MRRPPAVPALVALVALVVSVVLSGCGSEGAPDGADGAGGAATTGPSTASAEPGVVSVRQTCAVLYHPPGQLLPRAIELVHDSPAAEGATGAQELVAALAEAEAQAPDPLAGDVSLVRGAVEAQRASGGSGSEASDLASFDAATARLADHCRGFDD